MTDKFTTIRVFKRDKGTLLGMFPGTTHGSLNRALKSLCNHPENKRQYVMAELPMPGQEAIMHDSDRLNIGGFYCQACKTYVFRGLPGDEKKAEKQDQAPA